MYGMEMPVTSWVDGFIQPTRWRASGAPVSITPSMAANLAGWWMETSRALESPVMPMPTTPMRPMTRATLKLFSAPPVKRFFRMYQAETLRTSVAPASQ